jgi:tetratricopeptide (TPR) repeat protein
MMKEYEEALLHYNAAVAINPDFYEAWYNKGLTLIALNQKEKALAAFDTAVDIKADYTAAIQRREELREELNLN